MDSDEVNELFDSYVPDIDFRSLMFCSRVEKPNFLPDLSLVLALMIALTFFVIFCKFKHRWLVRVKCSFCNCIVRVWRGSIHWWFCYNCERINSVTKNSSLLIDKSTSSIDENKEDSSTILNDSSILTEDKNEQTEDFNNLKKILSSKLPTGLKTNNTPVGSYKRKNSFSYFENDLDEQTDEVANLPNNIIHKKLINNNISMRLELLNAETKLCKQMKQLNELHKGLRGNKDATSDDHNFQSEIFSGNSFTRIKRRSTFNYPMKDSNIRVEQEEEEERDYITNFQLAPILEQINQLKILHLNEISRLKDQLSEKEHIIFKLDELNQQMVEMHQKLQYDNERIVRRRADRSIKLKDLTLTKERHGQDLERISRDAYQLYSNHHLDKPQSRTAPDSPTHLNL